MEDSRLTLHITLRIHWRLSTILKTTNKSVWSNVFWYVKVCIFWKCIQYIMHWDGTQILKILLWIKWTLQKMLSFFFREFQLITVLLLICDTYMNWNTSFVSLKLCGIFHFQLRLVFIKVYIFAQQNARTLFL